MPDPIVFIDLARNEEDARSAFRNQLTMLKKRERETGLTDEEQKTLWRLELIDALVKEEEKNGEDEAVSVDAVYVALKSALGDYLARPDGGGFVLRDHFKGKLPSQLSADTQGFRGLMEAANELPFAAVYGALRAEGIPEPEMTYAPKGGGEWSPSENDAEKAGEFELRVAEVSQRFQDLMARSLAFYNQNKAVFDPLLQTLGEAEDVGAEGKVRLSDWWVIGENLAKRGVDGGDPNLQARIRVAIDAHFGDATDTYSSTTEILLPDLEAESDQEIQRSNLEAAQAIYFAAMMDEARVFDVVDKLAELFQVGALSLQRGFAGDFLYQYIRKTPERMSQYERHNLYARVFGAPTGDPNGMAHSFRNFDDLWIRFVSSVSDWYRKHQVENLLSSAGGFVASQEQMRKAALDLGANLSLYCYGSAYFAAVELQRLIRDYIRLLSDPEIKHLYGSRDMWQVIDQVSLLEFGRPTNTVRARTMANSGAVIIGWLARRAYLLSAPGAARIIDPSAVQNPRIRPTVQAINDPNDYDLVAACEQWLAIEGVGEEIVGAKSGAAPSSVNATLPVRVPPAAQEVLGAFGFADNAPGRS